MVRLSISAPNYPSLIKSLEGHDLLPAIVFISSRRGCDEATESFRSNLIDNLSPRRTEEIINEISKHDPNEVKYITGHRHYWLLTKKGIATHHAGHLPIWKHTVEKLMSKGLLRAVFATTTLAAGIDMPARSVVITASSLRSDEGHRDLKAFELAQMTGRAGRRGKDKVGFAIFVPGPFQDIHMIVDLLGKDPEPIDSRFSANYTMVLNLMQQHTVEDAQDLLGKSFGQYQRLKRVDGLKRRYEQVMSEIKADDKDRPCLDRASTWTDYAELSEHLGKSKRALKNLRRKLKRDLDSALDPQEEVEALSESDDAKLKLEEQINALSRKVEELTSRKDAMACPQCPQVSTCSRTVVLLKGQQREARRLEGVVGELEHGLWERFEDCARLLQQFDYLDNDWKPTTDGIWASKLRVENTLFVAELMRAGYFETDDARLLAGLVGALAASDREIDVEYQEGEEVLIPHFKIATKTSHKLAHAQGRAGLYFPIILDQDAARVVWLWADDHLRWKDMFEQLRADEGDIVRLILRTSDILGQLTYLKNTHRQLAELARDAITLIRRPPIED
ncbi:MAG: hypothetical protein JNN15_05120 [Blastocatellia bacterium]|nr:hypothetical protein [Blastocatellia bacterium]